jgi:hypothetical protein
MNSISVLVWVALSSFLNRPTSHVVVLQLLDNVRVAYNVISTKDPIVSCRKDNNGHYHKEGDIENCLPMFGGPAEVVVGADATLPGWLLLNQPRAKAIVQKYVRQKFGYKLIY